MSVQVSIHLGSAAYSRQTFLMGDDGFGSLYLDESKSTKIIGDEAHLRLLADELLTLADDIAYRSFPLSADEVRRREATRQAQRVRLLAQKLERTGGEFRADLEADGLEPWERELLAGGGDL